MRSGDIIQVNEEQTVTRSLHRIAQEEVDVVGRPCVLRRLGHTELGHAIR